MNDSHQLFTEKHRRSLTKSLTGKRLIIMSVPKEPTLIYRHIMYLNKIIKMTIIMEKDANDDRPLNMG